MNTAQKNSATDVKTPAIDVRDLVYRRGGRTILDHVSLRAEPGDVFALIGPNGSGKSSTLRCLLGLARPASGTVDINGAPYRQHGNASGIGVALDNSGFNPHHRGRDALRIRAAAMGLRGEPARSAISQTLSIVGMTEAAGRRIGRYSYGMRQRLGLAGALLGSPRTLVLDEPSNGLDPAGIRWLREFISDFAALGGTVLVTSHNLSEMTRSATRFAVIDNGRITSAPAAGEIDDLEAHFFAHTSQTAAH